MSLSPDEISKITREVCKKHFDKFAFEVIDDLTDDGRDTSFIIPEFICPEPGEHLFFPLINPDSIIKKLT